MTAVPERSPQGVLVTLDAIFQTVNSTESKVDTLTEQSNQRGKQVDDHEARLRVMEAQIWKWAGVAAALGIGGGFGLTKILGG